MRPTIPVFVASLAGIALLWAGTNSSAHMSVGSDRRGGLAASVDRANLVFMGRVARVEYKTARSRSSEEGPLPVTFVTYEVGEVLRGKSPGKTFTMRFLGGSDGRGRFLDVSGVPKFRAGDQDILLVKGNGSDGCALVNCEWGRFRVLDGGVYNTHGAPVRAVLKDGVVARGAPPAAFTTFSYPTPKFDDLMENPKAREQLKKNGMSVDDARKRYEREAPKEIVVTLAVPDAAGQAGDKLRSAEPTSAPGDRAAAIPEKEMPEGPMAVEEFVAHVKRIAKGARRSPVAVVSIDAAQSLVVEAPTLRKPAAAPRQPPSIKPQTAEEAAELKALEAQDFDPVIKRR